MVRLYAGSWMMVVSMAAICAGVETVTWEEGRFTSNFPEKPKVGEQVLRLPVGNVTMHTFTAEFPQQTGEMLVTYSDYPPQVQTATRFDAILDAVATGSVEGMKGTMVKSDRITQAGAPGREFSWTAAGANGPVTGRARIFLVGPRLYQVFIIGSEKSLTADVSNDFFKSFEFKPASATPATPKRTAPGAMSNAASPTPAPAKGATRGKTAAKGRDRWITHTGISYEGAWNVQMPTRPEHTTEPGLFGVRVRNVHVASDGKLTYTLKIQVTPDDALNEGTESVLAAARDKLAEEVGGNVVKETDAKIAGYEGHAYRLDVAGTKPMAVAARAAIVGKRTVVLWVIGDRAAVAGPSAERFLDSFRVGN